jgi:hypothetical protein
VDRPRAADDFVTIRARVEELRREREQAEAGQADLQLDPLTHPRRSIYWPERGVAQSPGKTSPIRLIPQLGRDAHC